MNGLLNSSLLDMLSHFAKPKIDLTPSTRGLVLIALYEQC